MRISSLQMFNIARNSMANSNKDIMRTQQEMSEGKRILTPADDPVASTKILQLTDELANIDQYLKNLDIAENNLNLEESILGSVVNIIHRMQEIAVAAGNTATLTDKEYQAFAAEVSARTDEMVNLLNTRNANGDYIFGGYKSGSAPFTGDSFSGFQYRGDDGQQHIKVANNTKVATTDSGKSIFLDVQSANKTFDTSASPANKANPPAKINVGQVVNQQTYDEFYPEDIVITFNAESALSPAGKNFTATERTTGRVIVANQPYVPGSEIVLKGVSVRIVGQPMDGDRFFIESSEKQGILTTLARFKEAMNGFDGSSEGRTELAEIIATTLSNLGNGLTSVVNVQTKIGARMNTVESSRDLHLDTQLVNKKIVSQLRDVDYAEAATRLSQQSLILQAAQQSFIRVSQLNLFSRL